MGRFDRRVPVELPDLKGREEILKVHARKIKVAPNLDYVQIARMASGASGAELGVISFCAPQSASWYRSADFVPRPLMNYMKT